ncbi:MAG: nucleotidyltransferase family protein [Sulfuricaulis sp.]|nr:nucleotidyltransferase family protein [Sulfuricaulis sp.]
MNKQQALALLSQRRDEIAKKFAVKHLALFGSTARGEAREDSDVDVLVEFDGPATFDGYMGLKSYLEELLGRKVDLVTESGLKPRARLHVEKDLIRVA